MGADTHIEWTDYTFNPWIGCTKVSPGCLHCYAETLMDTRYGRVQWGKGNPRVRTSAANWRLPVRWNALASRMVVPAGATLETAKIERKPRPRVFCASLADWLDEEVPIEWFCDLLQLISGTFFLDWQLLSKRPENWATRMLDAETARPELHDFIKGWMSGYAPSNVWIGTSVEDQTRANERIPQLLAIPARIRFLSCEPLIGALEFTNVTHRSDCVSVLGKRALEGVHWVIVGGESGGGARQCNEDWIRSIVRQCKTIGVAAFVKQLGAHPVMPSGCHSPYKDKKGGDISAWPVDLRVREMPV